MKKKSLIDIFSFCLLCTAFLSKPVFAETKTGDGSGTVTFTGDYSDVGILDPENPTKQVKPGNSPSTKGDLRIDFVPTFQFTGENKISNKDTIYASNAQLFLDDTAARGNFIQVSDYRGASLGWLLQVRQETQFRNSNTANSQLSGAYLSFDKSWVNSTVESKYAPTISKEVVHLVNIGETYNLAEATPGTGMGTWSISFGASKENSLEKESTLQPKKDRNNQAMLDGNFNNQQIYENSALTLTVPGSTKKDAVTYSTVLTWLLAELP